MNRKQWFVIGIGLILMGVFIGVLSGLGSCSAIHNTYLEMISEASDSNLSIEYIQMLSSSSDAWAISCYDMDIALQTIYAISFTIGVLFIICGFLEPKKK